MAWSVVSAVKKKPTTVRGSWSGSMTGIFGSRSQLDDLLDTLLGRDVFTCLWMGI